MPPSNPAPAASALPLVAAKAPPETTAAPRFHTPRRMAASSTVPRLSRPWALAAAVILGAAAPDPAPPAPARDPAPSTAAISAAPALSAEDIAAWAGSLYPKALAEHRFTAAALVVVQGGRTLFSGTWGTEDLSTPASADTLFRLQSVSKTFTATAIELLVEQGRIHGLDDPANRYLTRVRLADWQGRQITVRDLLGHRAGLAADFWGFTVDGPRDRLLTPAELAPHIPPLLNPPGNVSVYSNTGYALLGVLVEDVTGRRYADFLADEVLRPLGMAASFAGEPPSVPPHLARLFTAWPDGSLSPAGRQQTNPFYVPSGAVFTTTTDMAKYLAAHLDAARAAPTPLARALAATHSEIARNAPIPDGLGAGFNLRRWNSHALIEKAGAPGYDTRVILIPDLDLGLFFARAAVPAMPRPEDAIPGLADQRLRPRAGIVAGGPFDPRGAFLTRFLGPWVPPPAADTLTPVDAGTYWSDLRAAAGPGVLLGLGQTTTVSAWPAGLGIAGRRLRAVGPELGLPEGAQSDAELVGFDNGPGGRRLIAAQGASRRVSGLGDPALALRVLALAPLALLTGLTAAFLSWPVRGRSGRLVSVGLALAGLVGPALLLLGYAPGASIETAVAEAQAWRFRLAALGGDAVGLLSLALAMLALRRGRGWLGATHALALALAGGALAWAYGFAGLLPFGGV